MITLTLDTLCYSTKIIFKKINFLAQLYTKQFLHLVLHQERALLTSCTALRLDLLAFLCQNTYSLPVIVCLVCI